MLQPLTTGYNSLNQRTANSLYGGLSGAYGYLSNLTRGTQRGEGVDYPIYDPRASIFKKLLDPAYSAQQEADDLLRNTIGGFMTSAYQQQQKLNEINKSQQSLNQSIWRRQIDEQKKATFLADYASRDANMYRDRANWQKAGATANQRRTNRTATNVGGGLMSRISTRY